MPQAVSEYIYVYEYLTQIQFGDYYVVHIRHRLVGFRLQKQIIKETTAFVSSTLDYKFDDTIKNYYNIMADFK